jgi:hypothetical protein
MTVLPLLDFPRCLLLYCAFHSIPYLQHAFRNFRRSVNMKTTFCYQFKHLLATLPSAFMFTIIFSASYLWYLLEVKYGILVMQVENKLPTFRFDILLPLSFVLCSVGYWESWIDSGHNSGIFYQVYQVTKPRFLPFSDCAHVQIKYGMRALNPETRICACVLRFLCSASVLYWSLRYHEIPFGTLILLFFKPKMLEEPGYIK